MTPSTLFSSVRRPTRATAALQLLQAERWCVSRVYRAMRQDSSQGKLKTIFDF